MLVSLDSTAARQMLLVHHDHPDGLAGASLQERTNYVATLNATGYPTNCKTIAISNGSGYGEKLPFNPGDHIIHWHDSGFLQPTTDADIYALPQMLARVFYGAYSFLFISDSKTVDSYHPIPLDNAPGGMRPTFYELFTNLTTSADDYLTTTNHCFVPTVSALGIPIENLESNLAANADLLALSPFDEIHYAPTNESHVAINSNNKRWLMRAALEGHDSDDDGWDDYQEFLMGTAYDSAASRLSIELAMETQPVSNTVLMAWAAFPNTQYHVWYTEELDEPWIQIDTIPPTTQAGITNAYYHPSTNTSGFFAVSGEPVDPVTD